MKAICLKPTSLTWLVALTALLIASPAPAQDGKVKLKVGDVAPFVAGLNQDGKEWKLADAAGKKVVLLYFYPKADTPGCTTEACEFRDAFPTFHGVNAVILGISPDTPKAQAKFRKKYDLGVTLAPDPDKVAAEAYGVWVEKSMYGRKYMGVDRSTFLIDPKGRIAHSWRKVKVPGHAEAVLAALKSAAAA